MILYKMVKILYEIDEIQFENLIIDGTKIGANANRYSFAWKSTVNKNEFKMYENIESLVSEISLAEIKGFTISASIPITDINRKHKKNSKINNVIKVRQK